MARPKTPTIFLFAAFMTASTYFMLFVDNLTAGLPLIAWGVFMLWVLNRKKR